jgi:hypothetical protein
MPVQTSVRSTTYGNFLKISSLLVMAKWILSVLTIVVSEIILLLISNILVYKVNMITLIILSIIALCGGVGMIVILLFDKFDNMINSRRERESQMALATSIEQSLQPEEPTNIEVVDQTRESQMALATSTEQSLQPEKSTNKEALDQTREFQTALATNTEQSIQLEKPTHIETLDQTNDNSSSVQVSVIEEPLTARNLVTTISALIELHTKCWLIVQRRFDDFMKYTDTKHPRFEEEANLLFTKLTYDSPLSINLDISLESLADALSAAIDAMPQTHPRIKAIKLEDQGKEANTNLKQLKNVDYAEGIAAKLVDDLSPGLDADIKIALTKGLHPSILQVGDISGLELS